ncbi:glycogen debranching protein GlgX [Corallincola platygyrae]|uniref:Glycogen debranching protein GlgX n=1 Tax=Corallincola platygyrae TaxID=1193278 RepID=A0ABW4XLS6_9GAMM
MDMTSARSTTRVKSMTTIAVGQPEPQGCQVTEQGCNFSIYVPDAQRVEICLFNEAEEELCCLPLPGKTGPFWHGFIPGLLPGALYGYRVHGPEKVLPGTEFDPTKLLIDPYARRLNRPLLWHPDLYQGDSQFMIPKAVVTDESFDWQGTEKPEIGAHERVLYELHVKGFTRLKEKLPQLQRGTYMGLAHKETIKYLKTLGVSSLQLMPICSFMSEPRLQEMGLSNYWGYNTINFFSPDARYAVEDPVTEFKTMVRELHKAGIEVVLDVVFNHTAEGGVGGPVISFRGIDNRNFYLFEKHDGVTDYGRSVNNTGCGNSVNFDDPQTLKMVLDSLRYWATEMQVDGFRFDLAVSLARERGQYQRCSAFFKAVYQDPVLRKCVLIAEPWDIGEGGYQLGQFPEPWLECNDRYRDTLRAFWRGDAGYIGDFATRVAGSRDIFCKGHRPIAASVNFITYHDGFTLEDMVSYSERHNLANGENNRDGHSHNLSCNHGVEGPTDKAEVIAIREQHKRNLLASLLLSVGTPHLLAGDEIARTQQGNNNAYCQDNGINWLDWRLVDEQSNLLRYTRKLIQLRKSLPIITALNLHDDHYHHDSYGHELHWHKPEGGMLQEADWHDHANCVLGLEVFDHGHTHHPDTQRIFLMFNGSQYPISFLLIELPQGQCWHRLLDTAVDDGLAKNRRIRTQRYLLQPHSIALLERRFINAG